MKKTVLYDQHIALGAKMVEFAGFLMPIQYEGIQSEHNQVREKAGLFDVSHMGEILIEGKDTVDFINHLVTNDVSNMSDNQVMYSPMCYDDGSCVDDLLIYRFSAEEFLLIVNASNIEKDYNWIQKHGKNYAVIINNQSEEFGLIALQGPTAEGIINKLVGYDMSELAYYHFKKNVSLFEHLVLISRTGYTGENGYEILARPEAIGTIFKGLLDIEGIKPCGLGCRDTLRFEASMPLYGHELSTSINPLEAGLKSFVKLEKNFIGRDALLTYMQQNLKRKLVGIELIGKGIIREGYDVYFKETKIIGTITTGYKSPTLNKVLGLAIIEDGIVTKGDIVQVRIRGKLVQAKIVDRRFLKSK